MSRRNGRPRGRPAVEPGTPSISLKCAFSETMLRALNVEATATGGTVQDVIRQAVADHLAPPATAARPRNGRRVVLPHGRIGL
jgi:hypothetical protein